MTSIHEQPPRPDQSSHKPKALQEIEARWSIGNFVSVGLDSDYSQLPKGLNSTGSRLGRSRADMVAHFNEQIVNATADSACAYKPNVAFYEALGFEGWDALEHTVRHIRGRNFNVPIILDAKRADIGNTNRGYAQAFFGDLGVDAVTVHPYLGSSLIENGERKLEAMTPFLEQKDKLIFVLCRTSNPSAGEFQDLPIALNDLPASYKAKFGDLSDLRDKLESNTAPLYLVLAHKLVRDWNVNGNVGLVVGATYPEELAQVRRVVGDVPILIPGVGSQAGDLEATVRAGKDSRNQGMIINSSRGIIFASKEADFASAARRETVSLRTQINQYRIAA